ncbi:MAG: hypothetical protein IPJ74_06035 [Saprospiraceae bacterium]|nr:hypothetical protein [Saprospiraceae bacterium]
MTQSITIPKNPSLLPSEDYRFLRQKGLEHIEKLGSRLWTDYNIHDPGITILELLCFAITELGYRTSFDIKDILAKTLREGGLDQGFFTANDILTCNPVTVNDFRKLLIDLNGVRNSWLFCKECWCELPLYGDCEESKLVYQSTDKEVVVRGTYDVLLELEDDPKLGDLNDGKLKHTFSVTHSEGNFTAMLELRLPDYRTIEQDYEYFGNLMDESRTLDSINVLSLKNADGLNVTDANLAQSLRKPLTLSFEMIFQGVATPLQFDNISLTIFFERDSHRKRLTISDIEDELLDLSDRGALPAYRKKLFKIETILENARETLHHHRNLDEDYCSLSVVQVEDIAVCADIELRPDADIELVLAQVYFVIELYLNPGVQFYTLQEMLDRPVAVEEIFNGPALKHGFILTEELEKSNLKREIRTSDIINLLMDIEGVVSVSNFLLTKYDAQGNPVLPSESWVMQVSPQHQPRLYIEQSKILFFKNNLPFLPANTLEVEATLEQLRGASEQIKQTTQDNDLPIPIGKERNLEDYYPIQYSFPMTYGIGYEGLPSNATPQRRAQAKQLKAYLLFYEQVLANYFSQLHHTADLFRLDESLVQSYYTQFLGEARIAGVGALYDATFTPAILQEITESEDLALERRNRFLDHLMARFGEQFTDYTLALYSLDNIAKMPETLLQDKVQFLKDYPFVSKNRGRAFNYLDDVKVCGFQNIPGLKRRIAHLLGLETMRNYFTVSIQKDNANKKYKADFELKVEGNLLLRNAQTVTTTTKLEADESIRATMDEIIAFITDSSHYTAPIQDLNGKWSFTLENHLGEVIAISALYNTETAAQTAQLDLIAWAEGILEFERFFIVEHLILRPKIYGQALLPVCLDPDCESCGEEDPYSFRLTFVMPGWMDIFQNLDFRRYAERTIRLETPAHLLGKICWVGNEICREDGGKVILCEIVDLLANFLEEPNNEELARKLCNCADAILETFNDAFRDEVIRNDFEPLSDQQLSDLFDDYLPLDSIVCREHLNANFYPELKLLIVQYFKGMEHCFQFNVFWNAWCNWLEANALFEPKDLKLTAKVEKLMNSELAEANIKTTEQIICACAQQLLAIFGDALRDWVEANFDKPFSEPEWRAELETLFQNSIGVAAIPCQISLPASFWAALQELLVTFYLDKLELLQTHAAVIDILGKLKSIYPPATLHDCEEGGDENPVRLDETILG